MHGREPRPRKISRASRDRLQCNRIATGVSETGPNRPVSFLSGLPQIVQEFLIPARFGKSTPSQFAEKLD